MRRIAVLLAVSGLFAHAPSSAQARLLERLDVAKATVDVDRRAFTADVRCRASQAACTGPLRFTTLGAPVSRSRDVRLRPRTWTRIRVAFRANALHELAMLGADDRVLGAELRGPRHALVGDDQALSELVASCRSGRTLATTAEARVFHILAFGVYACSPERSSPSLLALDEPEIFLPSVSAAGFAGSFVALVTSSSWKCSRTRISVYDLRTGGLVRSATNATTIASNANGCDSSSDIARVVLRPTGSVAWSETKGDAGLASVRVLDGGAPRLLETGPDLDPASLTALDDHRIGWTVAGEPREAPLT